MNDPIESAVADYRNGQFREAERVCRQILAREPRSPNGNFVLGLALERLNRLSEAATAYSTAIDIAPKDPNYRVCLGQLLKRLGKSAEAIECFTEALKLRESAVGYVEVAELHLRQGNHPEAERALNAAVQLDANSGLAHELLGLVLEETGRFSESEQELKVAYELQPGKASILYRLVRSRRQCEQDRGMVERLTALIESPSLNDDQQRYAHYALGKTYDDLADYRSAIGHFDIANSLSRQVQFGDKTFPYAEFRATFEAIKRSFSSEFLRRNRTSFGDPSARPLFIVGMLRSGTTLLEQILSCHPDIVAGGELTFWLDQPAKAALHTVLAGQIEASGIGRLAGQYVRTIGQIAGNSLHVTDKMPNNYMALGLVHLAFPNAKIIHCRRDPGDTCLSIYTTVFSQPPKFAYDRDSIVAAYGLYQDLMEHWTAVIPAESLLTVDYERLIANPESVTRRIAEFCGLPWDQAFLNHQENPRAVNTPSLWQVRQPLYPTSIGRWKNYEPWLGSFDLLHHQEELAEANG